MIFQTPRLQIRPLHPGDLEAMYEMQGNPRVMQYTSGKAMSREEVEDDLLRLIANYSRPGNTFWVWAMERKEDGLFAGTCALILNDKQETEIGYRVPERYWGNGYGVEVVKGLSRYAIEEKGHDRLVAYVYEDHAASWKVLDRAGYRLVKKFYNEEESCWDRIYELKKDDL